uniref:MATH domain-containing protein n=1 Tax=Strongyloides stercoralis TaxID=6248 RepID=A0A0K0E7D1_STRER
MEESLCRSRSKLLCDEETIETCNNETQTEGGSLLEIIEDDYILDNKSCENDKLDLKANKKVPFDEESFIDVSKESNLEVKAENCPPFGLWRPMCTNSIFVCLYNVVSMKDRFQSPPKYISGFPWRLYVERVTNCNNKSGDHLLFFVELCESKRKPKVSASCQFILFTQDANRPNLIKHNYYLYWEENNNSGYKNFISMDELINPDNNYMANGKIFLEVIIDVNKEVTNEEIDINLKKHFELINTFKKSGRLCDARNLCLKAIRFSNHLKLSDNGQFKRELDEITNFLIKETIDRIERNILENVVLNKKILKKESDLEKICQIKLKIEDIYVEKNGNEKNGNEIKENDQGNSKKGGLKVRRKKRVDIKKCNCMHKSPDEVHICGECENLYESKTFFYHFNGDKTIYYTLFGSRLYIAQVCLEKADECDTIYSDSRILTIEKFFNKCTRFNSSIEGKFIGKISYINKNFGELIFDIQKGRNDFQKTMMAIKAWNIKSNDNFANEVGIKLQNYLNRIDAFDGISSIQFSEYPTENVLEYIKNNIIFSVRLFKQFYKRNQVHSFNNVLDLINDPNRERIFQGSDNYLCLFPTMWLTVIMQTLDLWMDLYNDCNILTLPQQLSNATTEISKLEKDILLLNKKVEIKIQTINKLHKEVEQMKKPSEELHAANLKILELEKLNSYLLSENNSLFSKNAKLLDEVKFLRKKCYNLEETNKEQDINFRRLQEFYKIEKIELKREIKNFTNQYKKRELYFLEKMYKNDMKDLKKLKEEANKKLEEWTELPKDVFKRNSKMILRNKKSIHDCINNISSQIIFVENNYKNNIKLIEEGKLTLQFDDVEINKSKLSLNTDLDYLIKLKTLETVVCDEISSPPTHKFKKEVRTKSNIPKHYSNQYYFNQNDLPSPGSESNFRVSNFVDDTFSGYNYSNRPNSRTMTDRSENLFNSSSFGSRFERCDYNYNETQSPTFNDNENTTNWSGTDRNTYLPSHTPYRNLSISDCITNRNYFNQTPSLETDLYSERYSSQSPSVFSYMSDNHANYLFAETSHNFSQTKSANSYQSTHSSFDNQFYEEDYSFQQLYTNNQHTQDLPEDNLSTLLRVFSQECSNDNTW